jgi:hypothetical protein
LDDQGVVDLKHEIADHLVVELDDEGLRETVGVLERGAVLLEGGGRPGKPAADVLQPPELPGCLEIIGGRRPECESVRAGRQVIGASGVLMGTS